MSEQGAREMTLSEYLGKLHPTHLAMQQFEAGLAVYQAETIAFATACVQGRCIADERGLDEFRAVNVDGGEQAGGIAVAQGSAVDVSRDTEPATPVLSAEQPEVTSPFVCTCGHQREDHFDPKTPAEGAVPRCFREDAVHVGLRCACVGFTPSEGARG